MAEPIYYYNIRKLRGEKRRKGKEYEKLLFKKDRNMVENLKMENLRNEIVSITNQIKEMGEKR